MPTLSSPDPVPESPVFWDRYKKEIFAVIIIAVLALAAFAGYRLYMDRRANAAAEMLGSAKTAAEFQKVISEYPGTAAGASAYLFLASAQKNEKKFAEANTTLQTFLDKNPKHEMAGTARLAMAANLESLGKKDEALATYQRLVTSEPKSFAAPIALVSQIHLLKEKNQIEEARRVCETVMTQYRDSASASEATMQLRSLKPSNEPAPPAIQPTVAAPPAPALTASPGVSLQPAAPPAPAPKAPQPSAAPPKKP